MPIWKINIQLQHIANTLDKIASILEQLIVQPSTSGTILQIKEGTAMAITGVVQGQSGTFAVTWNGGMQAGQVTAWTSSDSTVTLTPNGDTVVAAVPATDTPGQFTLTATGMNSASPAVQVTATASVPILLAPPPPATSGTINQTA